MSKVVDGILKDLKNIPESLRKKMKGTDKNKLIRMSIPYVIVGYFCDKSAWMFRQVEGDLFPRLMDTASRLGEAFANPLPSFNPMDLLFGVACGVGFRLIVYFKAKNAKSSDTEWSMAAQDGEMPRISSHIWIRYSRTISS